MTRTTMHHKKTRPNTSTQRNPNLNLCQNSEMQCLCPVPFCFCLHWCRNTQRRDGSRQIKNPNFSNSTARFDRAYRESFVIPSDLEMHALQLRNPWLGAVTMSTGHNIVADKDIRWWQRGLMRTVHGEFCATM